MTVSQLIDKLKTCNPNYTVNIFVLDQISGRAGTYEPVSDYIFQNDSNEEVILDTDQYDQSRARKNQLKAPLYLGRYSGVTPTVSRSID